MCLDHALAVQKEKVVLNRILRLFLALLLFLPCPLWGADSAATPATQVAPDKAAQTYPGLSELGPRSTEEAGFVAKAQDQLKQLAELGSLGKSLDQLAEQVKKLNLEIKPFGSPETWYVDRLTHYSRQFAQLQQSLDGLQEDLTNRQQQVEGIREQTATDREFWSQWAAELKKQKLQLPQQTLSRVRQQLQQLDKEIKADTDKLLALQERAGAIQRDLIVTTDSLKLGLEKLRQATFRKNAHSFFSPLFFEQFDRELLLKARDGLVAVFTFDWSFIEESSFRFGLMLVAFFGISGLIFLYRKRFEKTDEWQFVLRHPVAVGAFLSIILFLVWTPALPTLIRFAFQAGAVVAATTMAISLVENRRQGWALGLAGLVFIVTSAIRTISLPEPLFRIYIAALALFFIPLLVQQIDISRQQRGSKRGRLFRGLLRLGILVLTVSLVGQVAGYINFSTWLLQASFETGMALLFVRMLLLLSGGGIDEFIDHQQQSGRTFFVRFGTDLASKLKRLLQVLVVGFSIFYLLPVWRIFTTLNEGWSFLGQYGFNFGESRITVEMLGLAICSFYLAIQASWLLQGMSDTHFFAPRTVDRGVSDAVKKLIHYAIVSIGFLIALGFLGMKLQNFIVLLGAFGVGIGFGLQDIVNNFLSGLILLFERPIKVGDAVLIDDEYGIVTRIGLRSTVVENLNQAELIVPNSQIISQKVTNWTLSSRRVRLVIAVGVAYGSDLQKVLQVLRETAEHHPDVLAEPKPVPLFIQFGASSLDFELRVWIPNVDERPRVQNELLLEVDRRFREEGIEIPFPQRDLHLRSIAPGILPGKEAE